MSSRPSSRSHSSRRSNSRCRPRAKTTQKWREQHTRFCVSSLYAGNHNLRATHEVEIIVGAPLTKGVRVYILRVKEVSLTRGQINLGKRAICRDHQVVLNRALRTKEPFDCDHPAINQSNLQGLTLTHIGKNVISIEVQRDILTRTDYNRIVAACSCNRPTCNCARAIADNELNR